MGASAPLGVADMKARGYVGKLAVCWVSRSQQRRTKYKPPPSRFTNPRFRSQHYERCSLAQNPCFCCGLIVASANVSGLAKPTFRPERRNMQGTTTLPNRGLRHLRRHNRRQASSNVVLDSSFVCRSRRHPLVVAFLFAWHIYLLKRPL